MTEKEFSERFGGVLGPAYAGAPEPPFDPDAVNESRFPKALRAKRMTWSLKEGGGREGEDALEVEWTSEEWDPGGVGALEAELGRCLRHVGFRGSVSLSVRDRHGEGEDGAWFEVR